MGDEYYSTRTSIAPKTVLRFDGVHTSSRFVNENTPALASKPEVGNIISVNSSQTGAPNTSTVEPNAVVVPFGHNTAIRLYPSHPVYTEIRDIWMRLWGMPKSRNDSVETTPIVFYPPQCVTLTKKQWMNHNHNHNEDAKFHDCEMDTSNSDAKPTSASFSSPSFSSDITNRRKSFRWVSWKSNGERFALLITSLMYTVEKLKVLINRRGEVFLLDHISLDSSLYDGTIFTGDLLPPPPSSETSSIPWRLEIDDVVAMRGNQVRNYPKSLRLRMLQHFIKFHPSATVNQLQGDTIALWSKPWVPQQQLREFIQLARLGYLLEQQKSKPASSTDDNDDDAKRFWSGCAFPDGLICQEENAEVGIFTDESIWKVKPKSARTRDLLVFKEPGDLIELYCVAKQPRDTTISAMEYRQHQGIWWRRCGIQSYESTMQPFTRVDPLQSKLEFQVINNNTDDQTQSIHLHLRICEFALDTGNGLWKPIKFRDMDKLLGNHETVIEAEENDFRDGPITIDELQHTWSAHPTDLELQKQRNNRIQHFSECGENPFLWSSKWKRSTSQRDYFHKTSSQNSITAESSSHHPVAPTISISEALGSVDPPYRILHDAAYPILTKFEKAKIIGMRANNLSHGDEPAIFVGKSTSVIDIAAKELELGLIPFTIDRPMPNGQIKSVRVGDSVVR